VNYGGPEEIPVENFFGTGGLVLSIQGDGSAREASGNLQRMAFKRREKGDTFGGKAEGAGGGVKWVMAYTKSMRSEQREDIECVNRARRQEGGKVLPKGGGGRRT